MVIAYGGQTSEAAQRVAWEFPEQRFTVIQGFHTRPNLAVYEVLQEQSAWLAGAAAGMLTKSNVVGHMSGLRVRPGLKARAAFAAGLAVDELAREAAHQLLRLAGRPALAKRDRARPDRRRRRHHLHDAQRRARRRDRSLPRARREADRERARLGRGDARRVRRQRGRRRGRRGVPVRARPLRQPSGRANWCRRIGMRNPDAVRLALAPNVPGAGQGARSPSSPRR